MPKLVEIRDLEEKIGLKNIKDPKYNHSNELLVFKTNSKLNLSKKRVIDFIFYSVKQKLIMENIKEINNYIEISISLKSLYAALGSEKIDNYVGYKGYLINLLSELNSIKILKINLVKKSIEIKDEKKFLKTVKNNELKSYSQKDIIGDFDIIDDTVTMFIGRMVAQKLLENNNYTQFNYLVNNFLKSIYSINLYHYLIASFQAQMALMKKGKITKENTIQTAFIEIDKFYEIMEAENTKLSESFSRFNDRILKRAIKELNESKVVEFEIIDVLKKKNGRKIVKLAFLLQEKDDYCYPLFDKEKYKIFLTKHNDYCNLDLTKKSKQKIPLDSVKIIKESKVIKETENKYQQNNDKNSKKLNDWNDWRKEFLKKGNLIILFENEKFEVKNNYLWQNKELLSKEKSLELWKNLYENRDKLQIKTENEYLQEQIKKAQEEENKYNKIKELREKYNYLIVKINGKHKEVSITDIQFENNVFKLYMSILEEQKTIYQLFESLEELEKFLKVCRDSYLRNKDSKIEVNENEKLLNRVEKIKNKYINAKLLIEIDEKNNLECKVINIKIDKNIELYFEMKDNEIFTKSFELNNDEVNKLEDFLQTYNADYLQTQKDDLKNKLDSIINKF
jgi:hypothetical protein